MRTIVGVLLLAVLTGCDAEPTGPGAQLVQISPDGLVLTTDQASYAPGAAVVLTLRNETGGTLGHNLCASVLERWSGLAWVETQRAPGDPCPIALALLDADGTATYTHTLPGNLTSGEYRFRTELEKVPTGERGWHASNTFTVAG